MFARDATLFALPFDPVSLTARGTAQPIVTDLRMNAETGSALFAVSPGALVYRAIGALSAERLLVWVGMNGSEEIVPLEPRAFLQPRLSPDGTRVALTVGVQSQDHNLWIYDFVHRALTSLTADAGGEETPVWSPEGSRIAFSAARSGQPSMILALPVDGRGPPTQLSSGRHTIHVSDWSPDGRALAWTEFNPTHGGQIRVLALGGSPAIRNLVDGLFDARGAVFSPDGRWIAYASNETGRDEVYIQPYPGPGRKTRISAGGGREPLWSRDGKTVYFRGQGRVMSAEVRTSPVVDPSTPRILFTDIYLSEHRDDRNYDVSPDGRRFLMLKPARPFPPAELSVVLNWERTLSPPE